MSSERDAASRASPRRFEGALALVTGGASGIGLATVERLAVEGARVLLTDWSERRGKSAEEELRGRNLDVLFQHHDAGDEASWAGVEDRVRAEFGRLHMLVNNAYSGVAATLETVTPQILRDSMRVNVEGTVLGMQLAAKLMDEGGAVVNLSSIGAFGPAPANIGYAAAKLAVVQLTQSAAASLANRRSPIRVNAVAPGAIDTHALRSILRVLNGLSRDESLESALQTMARASPLRRVGKAAELASAIAFLLSEDAAFITGQCLRVDGGASLS